MRKTKFYGVGTDFDSGYLPAGWLVASGTRGQESAFCYVLMK